MFSDVHFLTRRFPVLGKRGMIASTQPLASEAGLRILQQGGNAADAAVAVAAALNVTEPPMTGIGGDACALFYSIEKKKVECLMGFGRSGIHFTPENVKRKGFSNGHFPERHGLSITVPGAAQLWEDTLTNWGKKTFDEVLKPAIELCESGFPATHITCEMWKGNFNQLKGDCGCFKNAKGEAPMIGELMKNDDLAQTFRTISQEGVQNGFYHGRIAKAIVEATQQIGGVLTVEDLNAHKPSSPMEPSSTSYRDYIIYEPPPPSQGWVVLSALNHLEALVKDPKVTQWGSVDLLHAQIESLRLAFFDALHENADPECCSVPLATLIDKDDAANQRTFHKLSRQASSLKRERRRDADRSVGTDTVYFCVIDGEGNACSFINSTYFPFGTGMVPKGCGFTLHNRGCQFHPSESHPNGIGPQKRPYNTIIPGIGISKTEDKLFCFGVMGAYQQPQGHLQVLSNLIDYRMDPQAALDAPRFNILDIDASIGPKTIAESRVCLEPAFGKEVAKQLKERGHGIGEDGEAMFGRGQIVLRTSEGILWGGTESRAAGCVIGW